MFHPFDPPRNLTPEQWKARARAIQASLEGLSFDELHARRAVPRHRMLAHMVNVEVVTIPTSRACLLVIPTAGNGPAMSGGRITR